MPLVKKLNLKDPASLVSILNSEFLNTQRWFLNKAFEIKNILVNDFCILENNFLLVLFDIEYHNIKEIETYFIPFFLSEKKGDNFIGEINGINIHNSIGSLNYYKTLLDYISKNKKLETKKGVIKFQSTESFKKYNVSKIDEFKGELSNTLVCIDKTDIVKTFRKIKEGINPDWEIHLALSTKKNVNLPQLKGYISYIKNSNEYIIAMVEEYIPNEGNAWEYVIDFLNSNNKNPKEINKFKNMIKILGKVIADLHFSLYSHFGGEIINKNDLENWAHLFIENCKRIYSYERLLPQWFLNSKETILNYPKKFFEIKNLGMKIRIHNDLHLGQILKTKDTFYVIDFEGEPLKSYDVIREKHSALKDIAGILRSFNYAILKTNKNGNFEKEISEIFLDSYLKNTKKKKANYLPKDKNSLNSLLNIFKLEKALYELEYEINSRPDWIEIPLNGIKQILKNFS